MTKISKRQHYQWWRAAGFTADEAQELTYGKGVNAEKVYFSMPAQAARSQRMRWIDSLKQKGWTKGQIASAIDNYYAATDEATPWDFIRENYRSIGTVNIKDYRDAAAQKARNKTEELYKLGKEK